MSEPSVKEIELTIEQARANVEAGDQLDRLMKNADFEALVTKGYFIDEATRLVQLKAHPAMKGDMEQKMIIKDIDGIGCLQQYFNAIFALRIQSQKAIEEGEAALAEIEQEEVSH